MNTTGEQFQYGPPATNEEDFTMDMETYLTKLYQEQGLEVTLAATLDFLEMWENCNIGPENCTYEIAGIKRTREDYAMYTIENIQAKLGVKVQDELQEDNWEKEDDEEFLNNIEELIRDQYNQYTTTIRDIARLQDQRDELCELLSRNTTHWAHFKFRRPTAQPDSIATYMAAKQILLKAIIPGYSLFRAFTNRMKQVDKWTRTEDDSSRGPGICENDRFLDETQTNSDMDC
ncbi:hypothetical protein G6F33_012971 [Rhizopus arrhizus]|uniref:Uncharacterized protein n=1 Tax=Rhizopus oryzae TaxID=64495 RepID=A0A9P6WUX1_RHIOR|nr:hypothetical protein G6F24_014082 [Rhizopus arrhizus]KAG0901977.1 hypothetical protein G6F33_012971 [Rhizopus arrhizus]KAG0927329.1 hypothetical protein G6F32_012915 [Rhizopus arrhizus]KAG1270881.1 hypothetical protein G6F66_013712 [Rhizopus arrhizus]KAG1292259.1 hypothetical protein G6F64_013690 [Rhizopus arrhizus]